MTGSGQRFRILIHNTAYDACVVDPCILVRIRILLFSTVADKMPTKYEFKKFFCLLLFEGIFTSVFTDKKSKRSHKIVEIKVLHFLLVDGRIRIRTK